MKRAMQVTEITRQFLLDSGSPNGVPLPPVRWFVRGPRGGVYIATGMRTREVGEDSDRFHMNLMLVVDKSDGARYVRPGTRLYAEAIEALA